MERKDHPSNEDTLKLELELKVPGLMEYVSALDLPVDYELDFEEQVKLIRAAVLKMALVMNYEVITEELYKLSRGETSPIQEGVQATHDIKESTADEVCYYCCEDEDMRDYIIHDGTNGVYLDKHNYLENDLDCCLFNEKISYCPKCGRKL